MLEEHDSDAGGQCTDTEPEYLTLTQSEAGNIVHIPQLNPSKSYRTLRARVATDGNQQLAVLQSHVSTWLEAIGDSPLTTTKN